MINEALGNLFEGCTAEMAFSAGVLLVLMLNFEFRIVSCIFRYIWKVEKWLVDKIFSWFRSRKHS